MKTCQFQSCSKPMERRKGESQYNHNRRRFCSINCSDNAKRKPENSTARLCEGCGQDFAKRINETKREFKARRFCGRECSAKAMSDGHITTKGPFGISDTVSEAAIRAASTNLLHALLRYGMRHDSDLGMGRDAFFARVAETGVSL